MSKCRNCGRDLNRRGSRGPVPSYCSKSESPDCAREWAAERKQRWRSRYVTFDENAPPESRRERSAPIFQTGVEQTIDSYGRSGSNGRRPTYGRRFVDTFRSDSSFYVRQLAERIGEANGDAPELEEKLRRALEARRLFEGELYFRRLFGEGRL